MQKVGDLIRLRIEKGDENDSLVGALGSLMSPSGDIKKDSEALRAVAGEKVKRAYLDYLYTLEGGSLN